MAAGDFDKTNTGMGAAMRQNPHAIAAGAGAATRLESGASYEGTIIRGCQQHFAYDVKLDSPEIVVPNCLHGADIISCLLGVTTKMRLMPNTKCMVTWTGAGIITKLLPSDPPDLKGVGGRVNTTSDLKAPEVYAGDVGEDEEHPVNFGATPCADIFEGEVDMTNAFHTGIRLLTHLAQLKAGDRAKVECHLLNDMVRIVSDRYQHLTAFGDKEIINDGGLQVIWHGTSYPHEAHGQVKGEKWADQESHKVDFNSAAETGRWRFSQYIGHLGNFISMFVTDPPERLGELAQERAGKFHEHVNNDGSYVLRSVADISFERVCRIVVPIQKTRLDSPRGKLKTDYDEVDVKFLEQWKYADTSNPWHAAYQLRDYARWLSSYHSYARFLQSKDFEVKSETESPAPSMTSAEEDVEAANGDVEFIETYSCLRLMRDGSTVLLDGYGNCTTTTEFGIHHATPYNYTVEAGNNIHLVAGNNIFIKARRSIELIAQFGGIMAVAKTWWKMLCEKGSCWIKSDSSKQIADEYEPETAGDPVADFADYAVAIDAPNGSAAMLAGYTIRISAEGTVAEDSIPEKGDHDTKQAVLIQAVQGPVSLRARKHMDIVAAGHGDGSDIRIKAASGNLLTTVSEDWLMSCKQFDINQKLALKDDGKLHVLSHMLARNIDCTGTLANKKTGYTEKADDGKQLSQHYNHTHILRSDETPEPVEEIEKLMELKSRAEIVQGYFASGGPIMESEPADIYTRGMPDEQFMKSETQRFMEDSDEPSDAWELTQQISDTRTSVRPWPGNSLRLGSIEPDGDKLSASSDKKPETFSGKGRPVKGQPMTLRFRS